MSDAITGIKAHGDASKRTSRGKSDEAQKHRKCRVEWDKSHFRRFSTAKKSRLFRGSISADFLLARVAERGAGIQRDSSFDARRRAQLTERSFSLLQCPFIPHFNPPVSWATRSGGGSSSACCFGLSAPAILPGFSSFLNPAFPASFRPWPGLAE